MRTLNQAPLISPDPSFPDKQVMEYSGLVSQIEHNAETLGQLGFVFVFDGKLTDINAREGAKIATRNLLEYVTRLDALLRTTEPTENSVNIGETTDVE